MNYNEQWHIAGPGAIGLLFHFQLYSSATQHKPILINKTLSSDFSHYQLETLSKESVEIPVTWFTKDYAIEKLIITTKSYQVIPCLKALSPYLSPSCKIILLHNGLGVQQEAKKHWPEHSFYFATTTEGAWKKGPHDVVYAGQGRTHIGQQDEEPQSWFDSDLESTGMQWNKDILSQLHMKVAINAAINPLTVLYECRNGLLIEDQEIITQIKSLCEETKKVFYKMGYHIPNLFETVFEVAKNTADNYSSSYQDWKHDRRTELKNMNGYIQSKAKHLGIETPLHDKILREVATKAIL